MFDRIPLKTKCRARLRVFAFLASLLRGFVTRLTERSQFPTQLRWPSGFRAYLSGNAVKQLSNRFLRKQASPAALAPGFLRGQPRSLDHVLPERRTPGLTPPGSPGFSFCFVFQSENPSRSCLMGRNKPGVGDTCIIRSKSSVLLVRMRHDSNSVTPLQATP